LEARNNQKNVNNFLEIQQMNNQQLFENIQKKGSFLCVGLDTDIQKIPPFLLDTADPIFAFNKEIIDATAQYTVAYKPNLAFYESEGLEGWLSLGKTVQYIRENYPDIFLIADAKRGDIGNTSSMYAKAFFEKMDFDAVTVAPYMGEDSVKPFLGYESKWVILLALTSNKGASDFQFMTDDITGEKLFERVLRTSQKWGNAGNMMYVIGATKAEELSGIRKIIPDHFLLVPGVGAQGGSLQEVAKYGLNHHCGLLVNSSRAIIYASNGADFALKAGESAKETRDEMFELLKSKGLTA
jgi:orotidine-5'-phosphate decarboxylase